jgi:hypothetical protein
MKKRKYVRKKDRPYCPRKTELIGLEPIQDLIELTLGTSYIKHERTASLIILANQGSGKTELIKKYRANAGVILRRRFTAWGIVRDLRKRRIHILFNKPKRLGHILICDLRMILSYKFNTTDSNIDFLDALTEEGLQPESSYATDPKDLKDYIGLKGGIIAGINPQGLFSNMEKNKIKKSFLKGGFSSRNLFFSYNIPDSLRETVFDSIVVGKYRQNRDYVDRIILDYPCKRTNIRISNKHMKELKDITEEVLLKLQEDLDEEFKGFRLFKSLVALAKASALRESETKVRQVDIDRIRFLSNWMNIAQRNLQSTYSFYKGDSWR